MADLVVEEKGVSLLMEYLILTAILSVFVVILGLSIHDVLTETQVSRVVENQFADAASQISAYYTDYILLRPSSGYIKTKISVVPKIGDYDYKIQFQEISDRVFIKIRSNSGNFVSYSGLGLDKFVLPGTGEVIKIATSGDILSIEAESEQKKPQIEYTRKEKCPFEVKPRIEFDPNSIEKGGETTLSIYFANPSEITDRVSWNVTLWNGTEIKGDSITDSRHLTVSDLTNCKSVGTYDYECIAEITAWINDSEWMDNGVPICNGSYTQSLFVSEKPQLSNPYLVYDKWVEPKDVSPGETFEVHLKLEGRGFVNQAINLSVSQIIDVSGSMDWDSIYKQFNLSVVPNVIRKTVNTTDYSPNAGKLEIYAYTTDRLSDWYQDINCFSYCDHCTPPPWNGEGFDTSFIKIYVNNNDVGSDYVDGSKIGKSYIENNAQGTYDIEFVARAPEKINLTIVVKFNGTEIINETVPYENKQEMTFELPPTVNFDYVKVTDLPDSIPYWYIDVSGWWWWATYYCDYMDNHNDNNVKMNVWIVSPSGNKDFAYNIVRSWTWDTEYRYLQNNPASGVYRIVVVPTTKEAVNFKATVYVKRIDAAKLAAIEFNNMLGDDDFVGLTKFSTDAERFVVNNSPLKFMTKDKDVVNNDILSLSPYGATDHPDALYYGAYVFPIWNEAGNNCTNCINGTRPLIILLTDGETTICDTNNYFGCNLCSGSCDGSSWCQSGADQTRCIANYLKNNVQINGFNVSICTIGFGTDLSSNGQNLLRDIASTRPDNGEPCYFFATTSDELLNAYRTIFNIFQIAAKNIFIKDTLNVSIGGPFEFISATATSNKGTPISLQVDKLNNKTILKVNITSIQKDETVEIVVKLRVREDAPEGTYGVNVDGINDSYIEYTALDYLGKETGIKKVPIQSDRDTVRIVTSSGGEIKLD
ncbi:vWA domain-containing protein [Archaeoglobus neptunius]|uniref:vWA domain-containing protein n=1 Tax=Archaeoglobus neptunius TaxID=2798580 RepID=UPI0019270B0B|nr:VWA domain-containing protein [Archaeoglobus neptunius]